MIVAFVILGVIGFLLVGLLALAVLEAIGATLDWYFERRAARHLHSDDEPFAYWEATW